VAFLCKGYSEADRREGGSDLNEVKDVHTILVLRTRNSFGIEQEHDQFTA
jgi:hypothetical protein